MAEQATSYPLSWPASWPRAKHRLRAYFSVDRKPVTIDRGRRDLRDELDRLGARRVVLSTNQRLRLDGNPYSSDTPPTDPGAAVYFHFRGRPTVLACDKWDRLGDNLRALAKHIEALRGQERWGVGTLEQAFFGYQALPAPIALGAPWREVLNLNGNATIGEAEAAFTGLAKQFHPDLPDGDHEKMAALNVAIEQARAELGGVTS